MSQSKPNKDLDKEIEEMISECSSGGGFGDPNALKAHEWKIEYLKHQQTLKLSSKIKKIETLSICIAMFSFVAACVQIYLAIKN